MHTVLDKWTDTETDALDEWMDGNIENTEEAAQGGKTDRKGGGQVK